MSLVLLVAGVAAACVLLVGFTVYRPLWGVVIGTVFIYNPVFNYRFLLTHQFEGGSERAIVSLGVLFCVYLGIVIDRLRSHTPLVARAVPPWQLSYVALALVGAAWGLLAGHQLRLVSADLFPVVEFAAYFPLVGLTSRDPDDPRRLAIALLVWSGAVAAVEVGLYLIEGGRFASRFALNGGTTLVPRLDDFIPALFLPLGLAIAGYVRSQPLRGVAAAASIALAAATAFSFFRSLWAGLIVAVAFMLVVAYIRSSRHIEVNRRTLLRASGVGAIVVAFALATTLIKVGREGSIASLIVSRAAHIETTSGTARVVDNLQLLQMLRDHPLGVGLGGMEGNLPLFSTSDYYLSTAVELGVVGILILVAMGVAFLKRNLERFGNAPDPLTRAIVLGVVGSYTCMAVTLLTFPSLLHYPIPALLGLLGGILTLVDRPSEALSSAHEGRGSGLLRTDGRDVEARTRT